MVGLGYAYLSRIRLCTCGIEEEVVYKRQTLVYTRELKSVSLPGQRVWGPLPQLRAHRGSGDSVSILRAAVRGVSGGPPRRGERRLREGGVREVQDLVNNVRYL